MPELPEVEITLRQIGPMLVGRRIDRIETDDLSPEEGERLRKIGRTVEATSVTLERRTPAWLVVLSFAIVGFAYSIVNHTQSMRLLGSRSEWSKTQSAARLPLASNTMSSTAWQLCSGPAIFCHLPLAATAS